MQILLIPYNKDLRSYKFEMFDIYPRREDNIAKTIAGRVDCRNELNYSWVTHIPSFKPFDTMVKVYILIHGGTNTQFMLKGLNFNIILYKGAQH